VNAAGPGLSPGVWSVGAGAIGGSVAARLARSGLEPVVVDADAAHVARLRDPGLRLIEPDGDEHVQRLDACIPDDAAARTEPCDLLLLAVRSGATVAALAPYADRAGDVVSLQNGLNEDAIAVRVGAERTIGCVVGFGATWLGPGEVELTSGGGLTIGRIDGSRDDRLERSRLVLDQAFPTRVTDDIVAQLWAKVLVNVMTVLGALGGMLTGEVLAPSRRPVVRAVVSEAAAVALAEGVALTDVLGCDPETVAGRSAGWEQALDASLDGIARHFGQVRSVTWRDLELGRPTEIDAVTGEVVRRARSHDIAVPANAAALAMLRECEAGARRPDPDNLAELAQRAGLA
jgi:2-dehydropantoate 2-reductase